MIDTEEYFLEKFLQTYRFKKVEPYVAGDVLDFGGNRGEFEKFVDGNYLCVNYDYSSIEGKKFDTIVLLAVIEHIQYKKVFEIFEMLIEDHLRKEGRIVLTTPTKISKPVLELLAFLRVIEKDNIDEHKHYWSKSDISKLAKESNLRLEKYENFQFGFNQIAILE